MHMGGWLTRDWHAATAGAEHSRLAPSSAQPLFKTQASQRKWFWLEAWERCAIARCDVTLQLGCQHRCRCRQDKAWLSVTLCILSLGNPWQDKFAFGAVKLWGRAVGTGHGQARWILRIDQHCLLFFWCTSGQRNPQGPTLIFILFRTPKTFFLRKVLPCYQLVFGSYVSSDFSEILSG